MAFTPFDRIMNSVLPHLPGATEMAIKQEFYLLALDFFKQSDVWWEEIEIDAVRTQRDYSLIPTMGRFNRLLWTKDADDVRVRATMPSKGSVRFSSYPNDGVYRATMSITVSDPTDNKSFPLIPYDLVEMYTDEFVSGLLYRMMAQPQKPYTNLALASTYRVQYRSGMQRARNDKFNENTAGAQNWRFPRFA